jgi:hypothetical protein
MGGDDGDEEEVGESEREGAEIERGKEGETEDPHAF